MSPTSTTPTTAGTQPVPRPHRRSRSATAVLGGLALVALLAAGCSSNDDAAEGSSDPTTTTARAAGGDHGDDHGTAADPAPLEGTAVPAEACDHFATLSASMVGDPSIAAPALESFVPSLPADLTAQGTTVVEGLTAAFDGDEEAMFAPGFVTAYESVGSAMWAGCEVQSRLDVTGIDYGFEGLPAEVPAGMMALRFTNGTTSAEPHELIVLQRPPGDTTPVDEIAAMPPDQLMEDYSMMGVAFADGPESSSTSFIDLPTGSYVAICTIPVGGAETGDPHSTHGMIAALEAT